MVDSTNISTLPVDDTVAGDKRLTIDAAGKLVLTNQPFEHQVTDAEINENSSISGIVSGSQLLANDTFDGLSSAVAFVTAHPDKLSSLSTASYRTQSECTTLGIDYPDGGGADYVVVAGGLELAKFPTMSSISAVGDGAVNNTALLESAQALLKNTAIEIEAGEYAVDSDIAAEDVIYKGKGTFKTKNSPNTVTSGLSSTLGLFNNNIVPERHLCQAMTKAAAGETVNVVIMGDSLATPYAEVDFFMNASPDNLWSYIKRELTTKNPHIDFNFINRAIGQQRWQDTNTNLFLTHPANIEWYTEDKNWIDYVVADEPDILLFSFGMNDAENFSVAHFAATQSIVKSMDTVPDIIFCTNMVPSRMSENSGISSEKSNEGRDFVSGYTRYYATANDYGLLDINRNYHLVLDGTDVENTYSSRVVNQAPTSFPFLADSQHLCSNFNLKLHMSSLHAGVLNDLNSSTGERLRIQTGPDKTVNNPNATSYIDIGLRGGFIAVEVCDDFQKPWNANRFGIGVGGFGYKNITTEEVAPSVGEKCDLYLTIKGSHLTLSLNNKIILDTMIQRLGQVFRPHVYGRNGTITSPVTITLDQGKYAKVCHPLLTDSEVWEALDNNGGNNANHPNTKAISVIYGPVINSSNLTLPMFCSHSENYKFNNGVRGVWGGSHSKGHHTIGSLPLGSVLADTIPNADSNDLVLLGKGGTVGFAALVPSSGVFRSSVVTESQIEAYSTTFVPALNASTVKINGQVVRRDLIPTVEGSSSIKATMLIGGSLVEKVIVVGAEDSAGTGFRALRIQN